MKPRPVEAAARIGRCTEAALSPIIAQGAFIGENSHMREGRIRRPEHSIADWP